MLSLNFVWVTLAAGLWHEGGPGITGWSVGLIMIKIVLREEACERGRAGRYAAWR